MLERNCRVGRNEADIVALDPDGETIVIVEVKTRRDDHITPELRVDADKQRCLTRLAMRLQQRAAYEDRPFRFDVVTVVCSDGCRPRVRHIPNAFDALE